MLDARVSTFLAVCRTLNYTRAARELNLTQSAVSQHMAYLERAYGAKLVAYEGKAMRLTEEGRLLQRAFLSFSHDEALLRRSIAAASSGDVARLNVGTTLTAGEYIVGPALARYLKKNPQMRVTVVSRSTEELLDLMDKGAIDCAFVEGIFDKASFAWDLLCEQELVCVCAADCAMREGPYRMEELFCEPLIVRERESGSRAVLEHALRGRNLTLSSFSDVVEVSSVGIIKAFVAAGLGVSFVYEAGVAAELACGTLRRLAVEGDAIVHDISFVRPKDSVFEEGFREFFEGVRAEFAEARLGLQPAVLGHDAARRHIPADEGES